MEEPSTPTTIVGAATSHPCEELHAAAPEEWAARERPPRRSWQSADPLPGERAIAFDRQLEDSGSTGVERVEELPTKAGFET